MKDRRLQVLGEPTNAVSARFGIEGHNERLEGRGPRPGQLPKFLEVNLKSSALQGAVIGGTAQGDNRIESVLPAARPALPSVDARMMDDG